VRKLGFFLLWLTSASLLRAQVTVEVVQDQDQFLRGESMPTKVRITNRSGQKLFMGAETNWLNFSVEGREGQVVDQLGDVPVVGELVLESGELGTKTVDLAPYFAVTQIGRYGITATVRIRGWDHDLVSRPRSFDVIEGTVVFEQEFGVPNNDAGTNAIPEVRKYYVQQANHLKQRELRLYLRVTDATGAKVYSVINLGSMVSFARPEFQLDRLSNLHLIFQNGAHSFSYSAYNPDGQVIARQTYDYGTNRPHLQPDDAGMISVSGGARRIAANDLPAPKTTPASDDVSAQPSKPKP